MIATVRRFWNLHAFFWALLTLLVVGVIDHLQKRSADRWTGTEMRLWRTQLARDNPSLVLPDVDAVQEEARHAAAR